MQSSLLVLFVATAYSETKLTTIDVVEAELSRGIRDLIYWNRVQNQLKSHVSGYVAFIEAFSHFDTL